MAQRSGSVPRPSMSCHRKGPVTRRPLASLLSYLPQRTATIVRVVSVVSAMLSGEDELQSSNVLVIVRKTKLAPALEALFRVGDRRGIPFLSSAAPALFPHRQASLVRVP